MRAVRAIQVTDLYGCFVAVRGQLACRASVWLAPIRLDTDSILCRMTRQGRLTLQSLEPPIEVAAGWIDSFADLVDIGLGQV